MTSKKKDPRGNARLEEILKRYETAMTEEPPEVAFENYMNWIAAHPGCFRVQLVLLRKMTLGEFLREARSVSANITSLQKAANFFAAGYGDIPGENPMAPIAQQREPLDGLPIAPAEKERLLKAHDQAVSADLNRCFGSTMTLEKLSELEENINKMELERNKILAAARLVAPDTAFSEEDGATIDQLSETWEHLEQKIARNPYRRSDLIGNLTLAATEMKKSLKNSTNKLISFKDLPERLLMRSRDYFRGGNREKRLSGKEIHPETVPVEEVEERLPSRNADLEAVMDAKLIIDQLSPEELAAAQKRANDEGALSANERQMLSRFRKRHEKED